MHTSKHTGAVVCAIALGWVTSAVAVQPLEMSNAIVLESSTPNQLVVTGHNFNNGGTVQLTLGGTPLVIQSQTDTVLVAELPVDVLPGSYVLVAWSGNGAVREDSMDVTIGAEGSQGPAGQDGAPGADGAPGQDGAPGADGSSCSASDTLDGAVISCTDGTSAVVFDGTDGVDGLPGAKGDTGDRGPQGPPGSDGLPGLPGIDGQDGSSCTVVDGNGFATINCDDGSTATVSDGAQGPPGASGLPTNCAEGSGIFWTELTNEWLCEVPAPSDPPSAFVPPELAIADVFYRSNDGNGAFLRFFIAGRDENIDVIGLNYEIFAVDGCATPTPPILTGSVTLTPLPGTLIDFTREIEVLVDNLLTRPPSVAVSLVDNAGLLSNQLCSPTQQMQ